jgi:hypothetical protein
MNPTRNTPRIDGVRFLKQTFARSFTWRLYMEQREWLAAIRIRYQPLLEKYAHLPQEDIQTARHLAREMRYLEAARLAITDHEAVYGVCIACGDPIPEKRLKIIIWTVWCITCASYQNPNTKDLQELIFPDEP